MAVQHVPMKAKQQKKTLKAKNEKNFLLIHKLSRQSILLGIY